MQLARLAFILVWVSMAALLSSCSPRESKAKQAGSDAIPIAVQSVQMVKVDRTLPIVGTLFPKDEATLGAEVEGKIEATMAEFGDRLTNGQAIAQIDTTTYEAMERQAAANLARVKANSANAEQNLKRTRELNKSA